MSRKEFFIGLVLLAVVILLSNWMFTWPLTTAVNKGAGTREEEHKKVLGVLTRIEDSLKEKGAEPASGVPAPPSPAARIWNQAKKAGDSFDLRMRAEEMVKAAAADAADKTSKKLQERADSFLSGDGVLAVIEGRVAALEGRPVAPTKEQIDIAIADAAKGEVNKLSTDLSNSITKAKSEAAAAANDAAERAETSAREAAEAAAKAAKDAVSGIKLEVTKGRFGSVKEVKIVPPQ